LRRFLRVLVFQQAPTLFGNGRNAAELVGPQPQTWLVLRFMSQETACLIPHLAVHRRIGFQVSVVLGHDEVQVSSHVADLVNRLVFVAERHPQAL
jgi:hypothetical protein